MAASRVIAVVGATGKQGGGLARAILDDPSGGFTCRVVTRNPDSPAARTLAQRGAEVVSADLDDEPSLVAAFTGAYGAYCMTNFFEHFSPDTELAQAGNLARAAKAAGVRHAIWSTSEGRGDWGVDSDQLPSLGSYTIPYWEGKAEGNALFTASGVPTTFLVMPMFWDNFRMPGAPQMPARGDDGVLAIAMPTGAAKLPGLAAEDIGRCAYGVFQAPDMIGRTIGLAAEHLTGAQLAEGLTRAFGEQVRFQDIPLDALRAAPVPGIDAVANMFHVITTDNARYCARYDVDTSRALNPRLQSFSTWLTADSASPQVPVGAGGLR